MNSELLESGWSEKVSNDPKHRPQVLDRPSTTVRKEWCRRPQEAHIAEGTKYRRLSVQEVAAIQGFPFEWVNIDGITDNEKIAVLGNAVPPPLSKVIATVLKNEVGFENKTLLEICAGIGGLSYGFDYLTPVAKIELWDIAAKVLRTNKPWSSSCVVEGYAQEYDYESVKGKIGLLCGGPPCQPWSQAGHQLGAEDPRDVMGFTPTAIAECEPEVFLFENVPGLFTASEHRAYVADLLRRMSAPKEGLRYGVATVVLNAADYGVPQVRRRVIILGVKNKSNTFANKVLNKIQTAATNHDPTKPAVGKLPWVTLRQAFADIPVTEPWKKWKATEETLKRLNLFNEDDFADEDISNDEEIEINSDEDLTDSAQVDVTLDRQNEIAAPVFDWQKQDITHIELVWPGKNKKLIRRGSSWKFEETNDEITKKALLYSSQIGEGDNKLGYVVCGDYLSALSALMEFVPNAVQSVYFDSPRLSVLAAESTPGFAVSTWLSIVRESASSAYKALKKKGFFILHTDEEMAHYGRQVLDEVFGRENHVTTFAWVKKYAPQNDKTKNNPTDAFDYIIVYSKCPIEDLSRIGLLVEPDDIIDDGDWRGCYTAGHKGAKSGSEATKFKVNAPPYRWEILDCSLPEGRYWFDNITGVLWFESVESVGNYWIDVKVKDAQGNEAVDRVSFNVREPIDYSEHFSLPDNVWWLLKDQNEIKTDGELCVCATQSNDAIRGEQYSLILKASGGKPYVMRNSAPGTGRYWEFALNTLVEAIVTASASFGLNGMALPSRKTYHDRENTKVISAVMNLLPWQDYGKSEDASRHVKALSDAGITTGALNLTAKPQKLLSHILTLFAPNKDDLVLSIGDMNGALASVAIKMNRPFIHVTGSSVQEVEAWENTASKRILATINGLDNGSIEKFDEMPFEYSVVPGYVDVLKVSRSTIEKNLSTGAVDIKDSVEESLEDFYAGLIGGYQKTTDSMHYYGYNGKHIIVIPSEELLDVSTMSYYSSKYSNERIVIIAERIELDDNTLIPHNISIVHAPFDLIGR